VSEDPQRFAKVSKGLWRSLKFCKDLQSLETMFGVAGDVHGTLWGFRDVVRSLRASVGVRRVITLQHLSAQASC
jgi:hypothetical protein